jgi:DNA-binding MarR family transcriptional regulator
MQRSIDIRSTISFRVINIANKLTQGFLTKYTAEFGVGLPEWRTLGMLAQTGPISSIRIAELLEMDRGTISRSVAALEQRGRVRRLNDPSHRKRKIVAMTSSGRRLYQSISISVQERHRAWLECLSDAEREMLPAILEKLTVWAEALRTKNSTLQKGKESPKARRIISQGASNASLIVIKRDKLLGELVSFRRTVEGIDAIDYMERVL